MPCWRLGAPAAAPLLAGGPGPGGRRAAGQRRRPRRPGRRGPHATIDWDWVDTRRQRAVPVRLYWPAARGPRAPAGPVPLVVFSHGIGGSRLGYSYLGRHLASRGPGARTHVQHVGSDRCRCGSASASAWWAGCAPGGARVQAVDRVHDLRFALDRLLDPALQHPLAGRPAERIDPQPHRRRRPFLRQHHAAGRGRAEVAPRRQGLRLPGRACAPPS
ncbi:MAG: hypothetical protein U1F53_09415 [Burkholderiaceae bacterium]